MSSKRRKLEHERTKERWSAVGKPIRPALGVDVSPGTWVTRDALVAKFAYYVMEPPICDENGFVKKLSIIRPNGKLEFVHERNKPTREVCLFETFDECVEAYKKGEGREVIAIHEDNGRYRDDTSHDEYLIGVCEEDQSKL